MSDNLKVLPKNRKIEERKKISYNGFVCLFSVASPFRKISGVNTPILKFGGYYPI